MKDTMERSEKDPWLYRREYETAGGRRACYYCLFTDWTGKRRKFALGKREAQALKKIEDYRRKNDAEYDFDAGKVRRVTFEQWAKQCKSVMKPRDDSLLPHLLRFFGSTAVREIDEKKLLDYRKMRAGETAIRQGKPSKRFIRPATIDKELSLLRKLMRVAVSAKNGPLSKLPKFPMEGGQTRERTLTPEEYQRLLENCPTWLARVCIAAYETCLTRCDLLGLKWEHIDADNVIKIIRGKTRAKNVKQQIPIRTPELVALFDELRAEHKGLTSDGLIFTCGGKPIATMQLRRALERACKAAGITDFHFHDFRHCAVTRWHGLGLHVSVAMRMGGHSSLASHKKYENLGTQAIVDTYETALRNCSRIVPEEISKTGYLH